MNASSRHPDRQPRLRPGGFTLTELMIATVVLLIVIIATSKIFSTASDVTGLGEATADIIQEAASIEHQIRSDFEHLSYDGFFAIQSNAVRNDFNVSATGTLLDPNRSPSFQFRSDQLIFFISGVQGTRNFGNFFDSTRKQQASTARVYYGHAFQLPEAPATHDPNQPWAPWRAGTIQLIDHDPPFNTSNFDVPVIPPRQWLLSRQVILLADDGGLPERYINTSNTDNSTLDIWDADIRNGRIDIAASTIDDIRRTIISLGDWRNQSTQIAPSGVRSIVNAFFFPRAERIPPVDTGDATNYDFVRREDNALTSSVLGSACSEFIVEWTYRDRTGFLDDLDETDAIFDEWQQGVVAPPEHAQPWFGWRDPAVVGDPTDLEQGADPERGVFRYIDWAAGDRGAFAIDPLAIERPVFGFPTPGLVQYRAFFGYNRTQPRDAFDLDNDGDFQEVGLTGVGYTPWPDAVRITMTIHDPEGRLENGRTFQFIVDLPDRAP